MGLELQIRWAEDGDPEPTEWVTEEWGSLIDRAGEFIDPAPLPKIVAYIGNHLVGVLTVLVHSDRLEILTLNAEPRGQGIGTRLIQVACEHAKHLGLTLVTVFTSNDNIDGLAFYQKRGFRLHRLYPDAITQARVSKPSIPYFGDHNLPIRDEIELHLPLLSFELSPGTAADGPILAQIHMESRRVAMPWLPIVHTEEETIHYFTHRVAAHSVLARMGDKILGFITVEDGWINHLYVDPSAQDRGVGSSLLRNALDHADGHLELWVFRDNQFARQFYQRFGFSLVEETDGSSNEEKTPDCRYRWSK